MARLKANIILYRVVGGGGGDLKSLYDPDVLAHQHLKYAPERMRENLTLSRQFSFRFL